MRVLIKNISIKSLVTGDKQARVTLETLSEKDIEEVARLAPLMEIEVEFEKKEVKK